MSCCRFKLSPNDVLLDGDSGKSYCASCWQSWIVEKTRARRPVPSDQRFRQLPATNDSSPEYDDNDDTGHLEAVVFGEGTIFHLVSKKLGLVFSSERTESGKLRCIGRVSTCGELKIDPNHEIRNNDKPSFPFQPSPADHCETPLAAYVDIAPALEFLAQAQGKQTSKLLIYDPYFCNGAVKRHLASVGFANVYNKCEDFYAQIENGKTPSYDVLVTNPPYFATNSRDHLESLMLFAVKEAKPFFILQPNYVYTKPFWQQLASDISGGPRPFFLTPGQPRGYVYETPAGFRDVKSSERKTSPFPTMWYCWMGAVSQASFFRKWALGKIQSSGMTIACSEFFLPDNFKDSNDKTRKKRKKLSRKRKRSSDL